MRCDGYYSDPPYSNKLDFISLLLMRFIRATGVHLVADFLHAVRVHTVHQTTVTT